MRDRDIDPVVEEDPEEPLEAMVAMVLAWGVPAEIAFGDPDTPQ
ncbi:hypothetical protein OG801_01745 [Nocardioides sp. NBC_00163]